MIVLVVVLCAASALASSANGEGLKSFVDSLGSPAHGRKLLAGSTYARGDRVTLYANKVGPFHNPTEVREARERARESDGSGDGLFRDARRDATALPFSVARANESR